jgi:hypothetical protein
LENLTERGFPHHPQPSPFLGRRKQKKNEERPDEHRPDLRGLRVNANTRAYFGVWATKSSCRTRNIQKGLGFTLFVDYRRRRKAGDEAFQRMQDHFPAIDLNDLAELAY